MSDVRDDYVVSFKPHPGYDAPLIVIRGANPAEVSDKISAAEAAGLGATIGNFQKSLSALFVAGNVLGGTPVQNPSTVAAGGYQAPQAPAAPPQQAAPAAPPGMQAPSCPHGVKTYKTGSSAKGQWKAWMCPGPKGPAQCKPQWIND